jgi:site-specific recombinase XerD
MPRKKGWAKMDKSSTPLRQLRASFALYNRTTNKSPRTVAWYDRRLDLFERYLGPTAKLTDVSMDRVRAFIADLQGRTRRHENNPFVTNKDGALSSSYIQGFARALRAFSSCLYEDGYLDTNVLKALRPPKIQQKVLVVLRDEEIVRLLAQFNRIDPYGERDHAIVFTLLDCGLRVSELCGLTLADAHLDEGFLKVIGKGNKEGLVPLGQACADALLRWRERARSQFDTNASPYFFLDACTR